MWTQPTFGSPNTADAQTRMATCKIATKLSSGGRDSLSGEPADRHTRSMAEQSLRFAVADLAHARRAATWKCWASDRKKDVYIACRELRGAIKLSLHESGNWHVAFDNPDRFEPGSVPESRFAAKYQKPPELAPGVTLACRIHTPWFAATVPMDRLDEGVRYIAPATAIQTVEVAILLLDRGHLGRGWPTCNSLPTSPVGHFGWDDGSCVWAVSQRVPTPTPPPPSRGALHYFRGGSETDWQGPGMRMVAIGSNADGSVVLTELPIKVQRSTAKQE
jgi:hypothetical protein